MDVSLWSSVHRAGCCARVLVTVLSLAVLLIQGSISGALATPKFEQAIQPAAAYGCNTGTTKGMSFTYDDVHRWNSQIIAVSNATGVPANVIKGIMWVESRGMLNARSPLTNSGYYFGLMQIGATSAVPEYMKSVTWMCDNAYNQILAGATELINKSVAIKSTDWTKVAGAYFGYGTDVNGTTTSAYMKMFFSHTTAMTGTTPGAADWTAKATPTATPLPWLNYSVGSTLTITTSRLNMRSAAGTSAAIIGVLTKGTKVAVVSGPKKIGSTYWYQIRTSTGKTGWISGNYTAGPPPTPTRTPTRSATPTITPTRSSDAGAVYKTTTRVNLRQTPSTSGTILAVLNAKTSVTLLGESKQANGHLWQKVQAGTGAGWISQKYLSLVSTPIPTVTRTPSRTPTRTPSSTASSTPIPTRTASPSPTPTPSSTWTPTQIPPTLTAMPTQTATGIPTETPTDIPVLEPSPTTAPPDSDLDGVEDALDACPDVADSGLDSDADGLDDACDPMPFGEPTIASDEGTEADPVT